MKEYCLHFYFQSLHIWLQDIWKKQQNKDPIYSPDLKQLQGNLEIKYL